MLLFLPLRGTLPRRCGRGVSSPTQRWLQTLPGLLRPTPLLLSAGIRWDLRLLALTVMVQLRTGAVAVAVHWQDHGRRRPRRETRHATVVVVVGDGVAVDAVLISSTSAMWCVAIVSAAPRPSRWWVAVSRSVARLELFSSAGVSSSSFPTPRRVRHRSPAYSAVVIPPPVLPLSPVVGARTPTPISHPSFIVVVVVAIAIALIAARSIPRHSVEESCGGGDVDSMAEYDG